GAGPGLPGGTGGTAAGPPRRGPQVRERDSRGDRPDAGEEHHEPVDAEAEPAGRWQPVLESAHVVLVDVHRLFLTAGAQRGLRFEACPLVDGIGQLAERVGELPAADAALDARDEG